MEGMTGGDMHTFSLYTEKKRNGQKNYEPRYQGKKAFYQTLAPSLGGWMEGEDSDFSGYPEK